MQALSWNSSHSQARRSNTLSVLLPMLQPGGNKWNINLKVIKNQPIQSEMWLNYSQALVDFALA
jgi:hypothetical protein